MYIKVCNWEWDQILWKQSTSSAPLGIWIACQCFSYHPCRVWRRGRRRKEGNYSITSENRYLLPRDFSEFFAFLDAPTVIGLIYLSLIVPVFQNIFKTFRCPFPSQHLFGVLVLRIMRIPWLSWMSVKTGHVTGASLWNPLFSWILIISWLKMSRSNLNISFLHSLWAWTTLCSVSTECRVVFSFGMTLSFQRPYAIFSAQYLQT